MAQHFCETSLSVISHDDDSLRSFTERTHSLACQDYFIGLLRRMDFLPEQENLLRSLIPESCQECPNLPLNGGSGICICTLGV